MPPKGVVSEQEKALRKRVQSPLSKVLLLLTLLENFSLPPPRRNPCTLASKPRVFTPSSPLLYRRFIHSFCPRMCHGNLPYNELRSTSVAYSSKPNFQFSSPISASHPHVSPDAESPREHAPIGASSQQGR
ncbi:hypothetical protein BDR03DRAFT_1015963 [Suillus americanus]|nr:hypothetical protein BDR03DRAFT_1015963 [Suillus americanus]